MSEHTDDEWAAIRTKVEAGIGITAIAAEFKVSRKAIYAKMAKASAAGTPWVRTGVASVPVKQAQAVKAAVTTNVVDILTGKALEAMGGEAGLDKLAGETAASITALLGGQAEMYGRVTEYANDMLDRALAKNGKKLKIGRNSGDAEAFNAVLAGVARLYADLRTAAGLKAGDASDKITNPELNRPRRFIFTVAARPEAPPVEETA